MDITPLTPKDKLVITHYGDGGFTVNGTSYKGNILLLPGGVQSWNVSGFNEATPESLAPLLAASTEILLIGTGKQFSPVLPNLRQWLRENNIAADGMDTGAACRTYSVLLTEGRSVAAALIAV